MSEVGVAANKENDSIDVVEHDGDTSYKGLHVSDRPSNPRNLSSSMASRLSPTGSRRVRRNSAGDEISSILDHETVAANDPLVVMGEPQFRQFHTRDLASLSPCCNNSAMPTEEDELRMGSSLQDQHELSSMTSSSLNTTVITKLEVSDR